MADDYSLEPVEGNPFAVIPKAGQTVPPVDARPMTGQAAMTALGIPDISKMTPDEQQMFALGVVPMLAGGPEAKVAKEVIPEAAQAVKQGIRAYHGSPHDFERFDLSKIGSGEGAQAFGHGLYFAENPAVAGEYKEKLSRFNFSNRAEEFADAALSLHGGDKERAVDYIQSELSRLSSDDLPHGKQAIDLIRSGYTRPPPGKMYEVNIAADPEHFLDWDRPLSEQHPRVQRFFGERLKHLEDSGFSIEPEMRMSGEQAYDQLGAALFSSQPFNKPAVVRDITGPHASEALREAGIPGIKYLDQGSRDRPDFTGSVDEVNRAIESKQRLVTMYEAQGTKSSLRQAQQARDTIAQYQELLKNFKPPTYNYVVFNDQLIDIIKKYGLAGLIAGGAAHFQTQNVDGNPFAAGGAVLHREDGGDAWSDYINPETGRPRITITPQSAEPPIDPVVMPGSHDVARLPPAVPVPALPTSLDQKVPTSDETWMDKYRREGKHVYEPISPALAEPIRNAVFGAGEEIMSPVSEGPSFDTLVRSGYAASGFLPIPGAQAEEAIGPLSKVTAGVISAHDEAAAIAAQTRKTAVQNAVGRAKTAGRGDQAPSPQGYYRANPEGFGSLGSGVVVYKPRPEVANIWQKGGISAPDFVELPPAQADVFKQALSDAKAAHHQGAAVTVYPDYSGMRTFLTPDQSAGFALDNGDIVSVFRHPNSPYKNITVPALNLAVSEGGNRLDAFDTQLPHLYATSGFRAVSRIPFNDLRKPDGWDYNAFSHYNGGRPDVVFMVHDPEHAAGYRPGSGVMVGPSEYSDEYTNGQAIQVQALHGVQRRAADVQRLADNVPGFRDVMNYMLPDEIGSIKTTNAAQQLVQHFSALPDADEMAAAAYAGRAKRGWYLDSARALVNIFGVKDAPRFAALLAAMSPQTSVENNAINALHTWVNWDKAGRPTNPRAIMRVLGQSVQGEKGEKSVLPAWRSNAIRALTHPTPQDLDFDISGPKVDSFMNNLRGYVNEVTNDTWMANYANYPVKLLQRITEKRPGTKGFGVKSPGYIAMSAAVRRAADILTQKTGEAWTPAEVQETIWSFAKTLTEKGEKQSLGAQALLQAGDLTHDEINATPDFARLFSSHSAYRKILESGGYGSKLNNLESAAAHGAAGTPFTAQGSGFTQDAYNGHLARAAKRLDFVRQVGRERRGKAAYSPEDIAAAFVGGQDIGYQHGGAVPADERQFAKGGAVKSTKYQANYRGGTRQRHCSICTMFRTPRSCTSVRGDISPHALCDFYERDGRKKPDWS